MVKNCYVLWHGTKRLGSYSFDPYDTETIEIADSNLDRGINKAFTERNANELHIMKYDEKGECKIQTISRPKNIPLQSEVKTNFVFNFKMLDGSNANTIAVFDAKEIAKSKINDYLSYNYDFFDDDEISVMVDELIDCGEFAMDDIEYTFEELVVNKC